MKHLFKQGYLLFFVFTLAISDLATAQNWQWAVKLNSDTEVFDMAVDNVGNAYLASGTNAMVRKIDTKGKLIWAKSGEAYSYIRGLAVDSKNNLYIAGYGKHAVWDGKAIHHIGPANVSVYVMKLDPSGKIIWCTTSNRGVMFDIEVDKYGFIYTHGALSNYNTSVTKLNPDGTEAWYRVLTGLNYYAGHGGIGLDEWGNCYVTSDYGTNGYPQSTLIAKFDPAGKKLWQKTQLICMGQAITVQPNGDFFVAASGGNKCLGKYDSAGTLLWNDNKVIAITTDVAADNDNSFYGVGYNWNTISYPVIAKWNEKGAEMWNISMPCAGSSRASFIKSARIDASCYVAGNYTNSITIGQTVLESPSAIYLAKLDCDFSFPVVERNGINFYPNPFSINTTLVFDNLKNEIYQLRVYNVMGQVVKSIDNITTGVLPVERDNLSSGAYFYFLMNQGKPKMQGKLIIQ